MCACVCVIVCVEYVCVRVCVCECVYVSVCVCATCEAMCISGCGFIISLLSILHPGGEHSTVSHGLVPLHTHLVCCLAVLLIL